MLSSSNILKQPVVKVEKKSSQRRKYNAVVRDEQKEQTRSRILESALRQFSLKGFEAASLRDISAGAKVTHAVIRLHFGSKEQLWRCAIDLLFERQAREIRFNEWKNITEFDRTFLIELIHNYVHYCAHHPEHVRIMIHETLKDNERVRWMVETHIKPLHRVTARLWKKAIRDELVVNIPTPSLMYIFSASSQMIFALGSEAKYLYDLDVFDPDIVAAHADAVCNMLILPA